MLMAVQWPISFDRPAWLWLLLVIPVLATISTRSLSGLDPYRRALAVTLRSLVVVLLAIALAQIQFVKRNENIAVIFVLDRSRSIPEDLRFKTQEYVRKVVSETKGEHRFAVVGFDGRADLDMTPSRVGTDILDFSMAIKPDRTDLASAMRLALAVAPEGYSRRVVLVSDGNENIGHLADEIEAAVSNQTAIDVIPLAYQCDNEILFDKIVVPAQAGDDTQIPVRLIVKSRRPTRARLNLYHNDREVPLTNPMIDLSGAMRPDPFTIPIRLTGGGVHRFDARLTPLSPGDDTIPENNRATAFTFVEAQGRVLVLTPPGNLDDRVLVEALQREKIDAEMRGVDEISIDLLKLQEYSVVLLCNISSDTFNEPQHKALAGYVRDFGGGLIMVGGHESFGAGGWIGTPVETVSPVSFQLQNRKVLASAALILVLDRSGSMAAPVAGTTKTQQRIANKSAVLAMRSLSPQDIIGVIGFDGRPEWIVSPRRCTERKLIENSILSLSPAGGTRIFPALQLAYEGLLSLSDPVMIKHIILLTDGQSEPGPYDTLCSQITASGITLSTIGVGDAMNDPVLRNLAKAGGGSYHPVHNPSTLPQVLFRETQILRSRMIIEQDFLPRSIPPGGPAMVGLDGIALPPLGGFVRTQPKADAMIPIIHDHPDHLDPILAYWNYEMGKMAVFTSGWWTHWGSRWVSWESFGKFWAQLIRWAMRQQGSTDFDIVTRLEGSQGKIMIEALNKDASYLNFLRIQGRLTNPSMETDTLHLYQTGPGRYEGTFEVNDDGNYLVNLLYKDAQQEQGVITTGMSVPYSPEYRDLGTNFALLEKAAERTGGRVLDLTTPPEVVFSRQNLPITVSRQPIWRWVITWLLLPLLVLDIAGRRLASTVAFSIYVELSVLAVACAVFQAWHGHLSSWVAVQAILLAEIVGWAVRYRYIVPTLQFLTHTVAALSSASQRSTRSLSKLKGVREQVRMQLDEHNTGDRMSEQITLEPSADTRRRFDVGDQVAAEPAKDLAGSLGRAAAKEIDETAKPRRARPGRPSVPEDDTTSRLLQAKRRAREEMDRQDKDERG
ncbi:MAG: VWA domain-containing protein [Phycisphaerales bacterium]|nr:VWA domain-containing protein [Phycisphaerales bacterium]